MNYSKYFNKKITIQKLNKGITNTNYLTSNNYIIKKYSNLVPNFEFNNNHKVADFDVPVFHIDKNVKITKFIEGKTFEDVDYDLDKIKQVAQLIKKLHDSKIQGANVFNPFDNMNKYIKSIKTPLYDYSKYDKYIIKAKNIFNDSEHILCHNDLTPGNFLFTNNKLYLIDWEYSGNNDPLFDVASFLNENNLYFTDYKEVFFKEYFENKEIPINKLNIWNNFQNLMWCTWANMMYEATNKDIYKKIASQKKESLDKGSTI